ncbi:MAG: 2-aminoethylphosphonate--pyruvate transaminase [Bacteroidota bacterium]|nr:2-aminoethylphosphonate--pyruvate transaminase [Odoribacter sp.]MDP3643466.1 2-aminoethylphosphonate--pyruvate transaminase [Bacteroidota bacterium]
MDNKLFTPGPINTKYSVKEAMLHDMGSRDMEFLEVVKEIRLELLHLAGVTRDEGYDTVLMQGSGTFGVESVISTAIPPDGHLLLITNGTYGDRIKQMAKVYGIRTTTLKYKENVVPPAEDIEEVLIKDETVTHVAIVHCETTTGIFNDIEGVGLVARKYNKIYIVDAMSSFGAVPIDLKALDIDFLVSSSNKCIEGVPGFSFVIAKNNTLQTCIGQARTISLDLYSQWADMRKNNQFRFTPPIQTILAFRKAIEELKAEGGIEKRSERYRQNYHRLIEGTEVLGLRTYLNKKDQGYIITSFLFPEHPNFDFTRFYEKLHQHGQVIYQGKLSDTNCFRIGNIGQLYLEDIDRLLIAIQDVLTEMDVIS